MSGERDGGGAVEEQWPDPVLDAPVAGVHLSGKLCVAAAFEAFLLLTFLVHSLIAFVVPAGDEGCASLPAARS